MLMETTGYRSIHRHARRRGRNLKLAIEPLFQFRNASAPTYRREGILKPASRLLGRVSGAISAIENPAWLQITPAFEDGERLDIQPSDLFIRLKYLDGTQTTDADAIAFATRTRAQFSLEVHAFEIRYNMFRILGDLS